jgi:hypothetical protein
MTASRDKNRGIDELFASYKSAEQIAWHYPQNAPESITFHGIFLIELQRKQ